MKDKQNNDSNYGFTTKEQELVLKAALLDKNEAISAWQKWESSTDLEGYHNDIFRLLPLLYHNLTKHKIEHPFMKRLKGIYKMFWYQNKKLFHKNIEVLKELNESGIDTMVFKGAPLAILHYKNIGLRPMNDIDILIKKTNLEKTLKFLYNRGWQPKLNPLEDELKYNNGAGFADTSGNEFDIHWHPFKESIWEDDHNDFWENSVPININDFETKSLCEADLLLHTIVHGIKWNPEPAVRWIADSFFLINHCGDKIDWDRFIYLTTKYNLALKIKTSLSYLTEVFEIKIPKDITNKLDKIKISKIDRIEFDYILQSPEEVQSQKLTGYLIYHIISFREIIGDKPSIGKMLMFPDYLRYKYGCSNLLNMICVFAKLSFERTVLVFISILSRKSKQIKS